MAVKLNTKSFWNRISTLLDKWNAPSTASDPDWQPLANLDAILLLSGETPVEDEAVKKSTAFQTWLLGYEFPSTVLLLQRDCVTFVSSVNKTQILSQLKEAAPIQLKVLSLAKAKDPPSNAFPDLMQQLASSRRIGMCLKEKHTGKVANEWTRLSTAPENAEKFEWIELAPVLSSCMAIKDDEEMRCVRTSAHLASAIMSYSFVPKLETILDKQSKIPHSSFSQYLEERLGTADGSKGPDMRVFKNSRHLNDVDYSLVETSYSPVIQSRGAKSGYDLKPTAQSTDDVMALSGVIISSIGIKYKGYCTQISRSFLVDPSKDQDANYTFLLSLQHEILSKMHDGSKANDIFTAAIDYIKANKPELENHFVKSLGFGTGLEFRDSQWLLNAKNTRTLRTDMILALTLGFQDLEDSKGRKYGISLIDTVKVMTNAAVCLTEGNKDPSDFIFRFEDPDSKLESVKANGSKSKSSSKPEKSSASASSAKALSGPIVGSKVLRGKTRQQLADPDASKTVSAKIAEHQKELHASRQEEGIQRFSGEDGAAGQDGGKAWKRFTSYKGEAGLPQEAELLRIYLDRRNQSVVLPINGFAVPFHVNTLKNAVSSEAGDYTQLRINFLDVGSASGKKEDSSYEDPDAIFIRSLSYRSMDAHRVDTLVKQITELKKEANKREQEKKEMADVVEQDSLIELKGRRPHRLPDVFVRPALDGKRLAGELEIHSNGLRYQSPTGQKIDLLFSNIKHLFFQPCDNEMLVIIHFHLRSPIMIGKKKAKDVQIYREASDVQFDETGNRKRKYRYGDEDEIELEQSELKRRRGLNKEFKHFADKIADANARLEVDIPFRELAFEGVPARASVKMQPTTECLVHLSEPPFTVVTLAEIEVASLERVQFSLKHFDMVLIFRDFTRPPLHINSIPSAQLDNVKEWLNSVDVPLAEGPVNLNWSQIMKTINDSPFDFFMGGGWDFLTADSGSNASDQGDSDEESEFEAEPEDFAPSSSDDGSNFDDDGDASDDSDGGFDESGSESGQDWDELEKKAAASDKKKKEAAQLRGESESEGERRKKKSQSNGKKSTR